ncbi:MAG: ATPase [Bacteroidetes bacterium]|nr:MAG: ATPase [Bacteroidota bacterium]
MILIADSGSTKTSWCLTGNSDINKVFLTGGMNPFFRSTEDIADEIRMKILPETGNDVIKIHFYGAGIINQGKGDIVKRALQILYPKAEIEVQSDLLAAARATLGQETGIACILGTGSNSCLYDGEKIVQHVPPLGFILGDEGSGAVMGRKIIGDFLKGIMPDRISEKFKTCFRLSYTDFLDSVYKKEKPNRFLAQFVPFLQENISDEYCLQLVEKSFEEFVLRNITRYPGFRELPICFVGSVAFYLQEQLKNVLAKNQLQLKKVLKEPLNGLIKFHTEKLKS